MAFIPNDIVICPDASLIFPKILEIVSFRHDPRFNGDSYSKNGRVQQKIMASSIQEQLPTGICLPQVMVLANRTMRFATSFEKGILDPETAQDSVLSHEHRLYNLKDIVLPLLGIEIDNEKLNTYIFLHDSGEFHTGYKNGGRTVNDHDYRREGKKSDAPEILIGYRNLSNPTNDPNLAYSYLKAATMGFVLNYNEFIDDLRDINATEGEIEIIEAAMAEGFCEPETWILKLLDSFEGDAHFTYHTNTPSNDISDTRIVILDAQLQEMLEDPRVKINDDKKGEIITLSKFLVDLLQMLANSRLQA